MAIGDKRVTLAAVVTLCTLAGASARAQQKVAAVSYFSTTGNPTDWGRITSNVPTVGLAIINPGSGTGTDTQFNSYDGLVQDKPAGLKLVGYVYTQRTARLLADVEANIERYYTLIRGTDGNHTIDGIFLDQVTNDCGAHATYYQTLKSYMTTNHPGAILIINPGTSVPSCYLSTADIIVSYEGLRSTYNATKVNVNDVPPTDPSNTNSAQFWHIIHENGITDLATVLSDSRTNYAGWITVCDSGYTALPTYWEDEITNVAATWPVSVTINARDLDNANASISGMCVFIDGSQTCSWTPVNTTLAQGSHTIVMTNFQNIVFDHWDDNSTNPSRTVNVTAASTFDAYYHTH